jgi:hypothetical protein
MKVILVLALGAALSAAEPLAAQAKDGAPFPRPAEAPSWFSARPAAAADPRLALPSQPAAPGADQGSVALSRLSAPALMAIGGAMGCVAGALIMYSGAEEGEKTAVGFNGCVLGGSAGIFLAGLYGLVTGA